MNPSVAQLDSLRLSPQHQTQLGQMCGSNQLFRDRYSIQRVLGRGGFGVTFLAQDARLPGTPLCVIKQLCPKVNNPATLHRAKQRFVREATILGQLGSHAQIPRLLDYFEEEDEFYLVQEYIRGWTLTKEVKRKGSLSELEVKYFLQEILPVLDYIHQHGVIHRDIKPPNIIRSQDDGRLVLIDFGAVKEQFLHQEAFHQGSTTHFVGTLGFAPAEQLALRPTYASDIFALGITCLYLLTGLSPMEFTSAGATGEVQWRQTVQVSEHFGRILDRMLKASARDRFQSASEIHRALALEPYLDQLEPCLHLRSPLESPTIADFDSHQGYLPPTVRTAIAIRRWRSKQEQKAHHRLAN
ncbi:MAG: serine/threonine protein kinase [Oculatellaceae cyanobacterium Prado106]|nr:serine/threonine protein kinase [Oculatellaceae cyanobacterium Prado106]